MKSLTKLKKGIGNNRQLLIGLAIGALVMLPTGLYISERASNNQRTTTPETTTQVQSTTEQTTKQATPQPVITPAPTTQTTPTQTTPAPKKSGVDCVALNNTQQALVTQGEESNYSYYLNIEEIYANSDETTRNIETTKAYNNYTTWVNKSKYTTDSIIRDAGCTPTITVTLRPKR